jgi:inner membrane protein
LAWFAVLVHIVSDLWTTYGTRALLPFDATWYAWDWIFIVDPALLVLLLLACFGARWFRRAGVNLMAMGLVLAYIGARAGVHFVAEARAQTLAGPEFVVVRAFPDPLSLNRWRFLGRNETTFASGYVSAFGASRSKVTFPRLLPDTVAHRAAQESRMARVFLDFSAFPRLERRREGDLEVVVWRDLRFSDRRANGFLCEVKMNPEGRIVSERIVF